MGDGSGSSYRSVLAIRDFRLLVSGAAASQMGDWLYNVALLVYVYEKTHSATWVAAATMVRLIPLVVLGPLGGVVADRFDRVQVMIASASAQWVTMTAMTLVVARHGPAFAVVLLAGANTAAGTASRPSVLAALPTIVSERGLAPANALLHTVQDVGVVAGPALGSVLLAVGSPVEAFAFNSVSFLVAATMFSKLRVRCPGVGAEAAPNALALFMDGLRAVRHTPCVPVLTFLTFVGAFTYGAQTVQLVVYVQERLHLSASGYGYLLAASGAGGVLGATISGRLASRMRIAVPLVAGGLTFVGSELLYASADITVVALTIGVATGVGMVVSDVVSETAITRATPRDLLGRVFASYDGITVGGMVLGALVAAPLVHRIGVRSSLVVLGTVVVASMLLCLPTLLRLDRSVAGRVSALAPHTVALSKLDIFNGATHGALERLASGVSEVRVREGTVIVAQGDVADAFYVCTQGSVVVTSAGERGHADEVLRHLSAPCYFGEIGLIEQIPRTATVTATTDCTLLRMEGSTFLDALTEAPAGTRTLAEGVMRGLARTHPSIAAGRTQELLQSIPRQAQPQDQEATTPVA